MSDPSQVDALRLPLQWWEAGVYENTFVREQGVWKIAVLDFRLTWQADHQTGWAHSAPHEGPFFPKTYPEDPLGPDTITAGVAFWPHTSVVPFHHAHPVTGLRSGPRG